MATEKSPIILEDLKKEVLKLNIMSTYTIDGTDKIVKFYQRFDEIKIQDLIKELYQDIQYAIENKIEFFENDEELIKYELFLIIKHFSHLKDEIGDRFEDKIEALSVLISTGLYDLFFEEVFDSSEVFDVLDKVERTAELALKAYEEQEETMENALKSVENKEIITKSNK